MYKIVSTLAKSDNGNKIIFYGIASKEVKYIELSPNKKVVQKLCKMCNKYKIKEPHLKYIIEDFIISDTWLPSVLTGRKPGCLFKRCAKILRIRKRKI